MLQNFGKIVNQDLGLIPDLVIIEFLDFVLFVDVYNGCISVWIRGVDNHHASRLFCNPCT